MYAIRSYYAFADDGDLCRARSGARGVKVDEIDVPEFAEVELAFDQRDGFASADQRGNEVRVGVVAAACVLSVLRRESERLRAGMQIDSSYNFV